MRQTTNKEFANCDSIMIRRASIFDRVEGVQSSKCNHFSIEITHRWIAMSIEVHAMSVRLSKIQNHDRSFKAKTQLNSTAAKKQC